MKKLLLLSFCASLLLLACSGGGTQKKQAEPAKEQGPPPDYKKLIEGKWLLPEQEGYQAWRRFKGSNYYAELNERGLAFRIKGDSLLLTSSDGAIVRNRIISINEQELVEEIEGGFRQTWQRGQD